MRCEVCGWEMELYYIDCNYEDKEDYDYCYVCENCNSHAEEKVRSGDTVDAEFDKRVLR